MKPLLYVLFVSSTALVQAQDCRVTGQLFYADVVNHVIKIKTDSGDLVNFNYDKATSFMRNDGDAVPVQPDQLHNGDRLCVGTGDPIVVTVTSRASINAAQKKELAAWQGDSLYGVVSGLDRKARLITLAVSIDDKTTSYPVGISPQAAYWFFPRNTIRLSEALTGSLDQIALGDTLYVRGTKDGAGPNFVASLIVSGGFRSFAATIETMETLDELSVRLVRSGDRRRVRVDLANLYTVGRARGPETGDARLYRIGPADLLPRDTVLILGINEGRDSIRACALITGFSASGVLPPDPSQQMRWIFDNLALDDAHLAPSAPTAPAAPQIKGKSADRIPPSAQEEIKSVELEIDRIEAETLNRSQTATVDRFQQIMLLGKLIFYDKELSVKRNEACSFCHMPETGFTGPVSALNQTTSSYPGSIRTRFSARKPQSHTYASFAPVLHYNSEQGDFVGGQFWDMRATGLRLDSALAEQAQGPPLNPVEMGLIDPACMVYRISQGPYRSMAEKLWGAQAFAVRWPANVKDVCDRPGPAPEAEPLPLHLAAVDRGIAQTSFDRIAEAIAAFEGSPEVSPFSAKYDYVMAGKAEFTPEEKAGYELFRSKSTHCNECHRDGGPGEEPLFTDFTASNLGLPPNPALPFYKENTPDQFRYTANPDGPKFLDLGVGGFLAGPQNPNHEWAAMAKSFIGKYKTPTLRNVDKRPRANFVKAYMHNGYLKSLKEVVHFYNTRDALPKCKAGDPGEKVTCWPAPENPETINRKQLGDLKLTGEQEDLLVAFLKTLTDGYSPPGK